MIGYITGKIKTAKNKRILVINNGVGYVINVGNKNFLEGQEVELNTYLVVKEQELSLYGFETSIELEIFELLLSISGVGPKTALVLVVEKGVDMIANAVMNSGEQSLKVSGIGTKTIQKIIIELKDKIEDYSLNTGNQNLQNQNISIKNDVNDALISLGYKQNDITMAYRELLSKGEISEEMNSQDIIKILLKQI